VRQLWDHPGSGAAEGCRWPVHTRCQTVQRISVWDAETAFVASGLRFLIRLGASCCPLILVDQPANHSALADCQRPG